MRASGAASVVDRGPAGHDREPPAKLLERALLGAEVGLLRAAEPKHAELLRQHLDLPEQVGNVPAARAGLAFARFAIRGHELSVAAGQTPSVAGQRESSWYG